MSTATRISGRVAANDKAQTGATEDLEYNKRTYITSPSTTDPWNSLRPSNTGSQLNSDILAQLARVDALGLGGPKKSSL
ncbi:hypothetical protein TWF730_011094 [Orbilia blumenaviensis]|uniref:Uncharacterized protein n=1 Tax=Orbilia blumenaviensis TaxID=1796055 RepID=A0AAV9UK59_9PEZI